MDWYWWYRTCCSHTTCDCLNVDNSLKAIVSSQEECVSRHGLRLDVKGAGVTIERASVSVVDSNVLGMS